MSTVLAIFFWDIKGVTVVDFLPIGETVVAVICCTE
jgi:hypothetical protein